MVLRLGLAQITSTDIPEINLKQIEKLYLQAVAERADLAVFPENSLYFRIRSGEAMRGVRLTGPEFQSIRDLVDQHGSALMLTTAHEVEGEEKLFNSTFLFQAGRQPERLYSKIHLFDVDVPGAPPVRESDSFLGGKEPKILEFKGWKIGLSICFDLRFSSLFLNYAQDVDLILIPSAFLVPTGEAHWHVLLRARAIENQCYVAAPAQNGEHRAGAQVRSTYGHSLAVDPWGRVLCDLEKSPEMRVLELDREAILKVRRQIPMRRKL